VLCIHGEVVGADVDFFDREAVFMATKLEPMLAQVPNLKVVIEHATTKEAVAFVEASQHPGGIGCTVTPQHLLYNRNALFNKGLNPHFFCLPILKREEDRLELVRAVTSGNKRFFAGTDSAPHMESNKLSCCGSAGCFSANAAAELYTEAFDDAGALDKLEGFLSTNGAEFYGLAPATTTITLVKEPQTVPVRHAGSCCQARAARRATLRCERAHPCPPDWCAGDDPAVHGARSGQLR
jgi:dihydroorotase